MEDSFLDRLIRRLRIKKVLKHIPEKPGIVCDIGCGAKPELLLNLETMISEGWGIDKKTEAQDWSGKVKTIKQDLDAAAALPFSGNKFDCLLMLAVLEHLKFPKEVLREAYRILKPEGIVVLTTPSPSSKLILEFLAYYLNLISKEEIKDHKYYFPKRELIKMFKDLGFRDIKHHYFELGLNQQITAKK